jgi:hypothetical protein
VIKVEPLISSAEGYRVLGPPVRGWGTGRGYQDLPVVELLLPPVFLCPMTFEDNIDLPINTREAPSLPLPAVEAT